MSDVGSAGGQGEHGTGAAGRAVSLQGLQQEIARLESEADKVDGRLANPDNYADQQGNIDNFRYRKDELRSREIDRQIRRLERRLGDVKEQSSQWTDYANRKAADYIRGELPKVPEDMRKKVRDQFVERFKDLTGQGAFETANLQNDEAIMGLVRDRFEASVGAVYASRLRQRKPDEGEAPPREEGLDEENDPPKQEKDDGPFADDPFAKSLFESHVPRRERRARTLADVQRDRYAATQAGKEKQESRRESGAPGEGES